MLKFTSYAAISFLATALLTACGGGGSEPTLSASPADEEPSPTATVTAIATPEPSGAPTPSPEPAIVDARELFVIDADGGDPTLLHRAAGSVGSVAWSFDASRIAFTVTSGLLTKVYVAMVSEEVSEPLVEVQGRGVKLLWSPQADAIAYQTSVFSGGSTTNTVEILDPATGDTRKLVSGDGELTLVDWLPSGEEVLITRGNQLATVDITSGLSTEIGEPLEGLVRGSAVLSPDGSQVAAVVTREGTCEWTTPSSLVIVSATNGTSREAVSEVCNLASVAWSPDGTEVAYSVGAGEIGVYVFHVETEELRRLTTAGSIGGDQIEWLADGSGLAIERCYEGCHSARFTPSTGEGEESIATPPGFVTDFGGFAPDGRHYLYSDDVVRLSTLDGSSVALTELDIESSYVSLTWAPDGESVAYVRVPSELSRRYTLDVGTGKARQLPRLPTVPGSKVSPDGTLMAFRRGESQLWLANSDGSNERLVAEIKVSSFEWSPDGKRIVYMSFDTNSVYVLDVDSLEDQQLSVPHGDYRLAVWSPDGSKLAVVDSGELIVIEVATGERTFLSGDVDPYPTLGRWPAWSPDGSMLLYLTRDANGPTHIVVVDAESGQRHQLTDAPLHDLDPIWSPDSESIAFWRHLKKDAGYRQIGLYVVSVDSGEERELARFRVAGGSVGNFPAWSPDGERIAAFAPSIDGPGIYVVETDGTGMTHVIATGDGRGYGEMAWSEDGMQLLLTSFYQGI